MDDLKTITGKMIQECACLNLRKANRALTRFYDKILSPTGIRSTQLPLLTAVAQSGPVTISKLAYLTVMDLSTLTRTLKFLKEKQLIQVRPGKDKRVREVFLTEQGAQIIVQAYPLWQEAQSQITEKIGPSKIKQLLAISTATIDAVRSV